MGKRNEHECAYCAEEFSPAQRIIGTNWKCYCSPGCARCGQQLSELEWRQVMRQISTSYRRPDAALHFGKAALQPVH